MQTTGPYALTIGTTLNEYDPGGSWQPQSTAVQVQNNSGYQLIISIGGQQYAINPFTQTTVLTANAALLQITPYNVLSNFGGSVTLVWLQAGESPPSPDGTLFAPNTNQGGLTKIHTTIQGNSTLVLAQPNSNYANRLHSLTFQANNPIPANAIAYVQVVEVATGAYLFSYAWPVLTVQSRAFITFLFNGLLSNQSITGTYVDGSGDGGTLTLCYDLVQI